MNTRNRKNLAGSGLPARRTPGLGRRFGWTVGAVLAFLALAGWMVAKAAVTEFNGEATLIGLDPSAADVKCFSGTPTGTFPPCSVGKARIRGLALISMQTATDTRVEGTRTTILNANLDAEGKGPVWGTWHLETPTGDIEGTYRGTLLGYAVGGQVSGVGHGSGGLVEGLKVKAMDTFDPFFNEEISGFLLEPGQ